PLALGDGNSVTTVLDGAQLQIQGGITVANNKALHISGTGIFGAGAFENVGGANAWNGPVVLAQDPGFSPATTPPANIAIGAPAPGAGDGLTINGVISQQPGLLLGINKVGPGKVIFTNANTYAGQTTVAQGILNVQNNDALGLFGPPISPGSLPSP